MAITTMTAWARDGKPFIQCQPGVDLVATLRRHRYTGPGSGYPDDRHLAAQPPQDHCPYSNTPWPGAQPYPYCMALDIMPDPAFDWVWLGTKIVADRLAGVAGTECIKYVNWTDSSGRIWHDSWQPNHVRTSSTDGGHIHISWRTDFVTSHVMASYDPFGPAKEDDVPVFVRCLENGGLYAYPVPKWYTSQAAFNDAMAAYGVPASAMVTTATLDQIRNAFGPIPGDAAMVAAGTADVLADSHGNPIPCPASSGGGGGGVPVPYTITFNGTGDATPTG